MMQGQNSSRKILVVDDDPHLINLLEIRLTAEGFQVQTSSNAKQALSQALSEPPDLVIADIMMPGMDGYQLCQEIRKEEKLKSTPFIFLSALAETQHKVKGLRMGADDYLTKPFEFHELLARLEILLDRYSRYQETFPREEEVATSGRIEDLGVIDLIQMLSFGQKTGEVRLDADGEEGVLYLMSGKLIAASYRNKQGMAALPSLLSLSAGRFSVKLAGSLSVIPTIEASTDEAIFESLRELDEAQRLKAELDVESIPTVTGPAEEDEVAAEIADLADGTRTIRELLDQAKAGEYRILEKLKELKDRGALELSEDETKEKAEVKPGAQPAEPLPEIAPQAEPQEFNLVVIGTDRDTRNTFIHTLAGEEEEEKDETVLNFGKLKKGPHLINLYGLPGAKRFAPLWQTFTHRVQGMILLARAASQEEVANLRFALSLLGPLVKGPKIVINTDPTHPEVELGKDTHGAKVITCLPSDRKKAGEVLKQVLGQLVR